MKIRIQVVEATDDEFLRAFFSGSVPMSSPRLMRDDFYEVEVQSSNDLTAHIACRSFDKEVQCLQDSRQRIEAEAFELRLLQGKHMMRRVGGGK